MRDSVLRQQWQFLLTSQIYRGLWAMHPDMALAQGATIQKLTNRDWSGRDQTTELEKVRAALPICAVTGSGDTISGNSMDKAPQGSTIIIPLKGTMLKYGTECTYGTEEIAGQMLEAAAHRNISSVIIDTDTGGGSVDSVAPMVQAIAKIRNQIKKPVVASADLCASAGLWVASACTRVVANNNISAEFGSIGVMMSFWDMIPYYEKEGLKFHSIYAPESNYKNKPFQLALEGKYEEIQEEELSPLAIAFQNAIKSNRGSKLKLDTPGLLNGRMFFAQNSKNNSLNAKEVGLIDEVGTIELAIQYARDLAKSAFVDNYIKS